MPENRPAFSIVVPTYARCDRLVCCLEALSRLDYPSAHFEVIVVDDGSSASPAPVIERYSDRLNVRLRRQSNAGPARARNNGAANSRGRYIAFTDDDCAPAPDWLTQLEARLIARPQSMVGGHTVNGLKKNVCSETSQLLVDYIYANSNGDEADAQFITSNNMAIPSALLQKIGGFDTGYPRAAGEDRELCDRWRAYGYRIVYAPEAVVHHYHALNWRGFWKQHKNYGHGAYCVRRMRAARQSSRMRFEALSFYGGLLRYPFSRQNAAMAAISTTLLGLSQIATVTGFLMEALHAQLQKAS